jgi:hypothetical protein
MPCRDKRGTTILPVLPLFIAPDPAKHSTSSFTPSRLISSAHRLVTLRLCLILFVFSYPPEYWARCLRMVKNSILCSARCSKLSASKPWGVVFNPTITGGTSDLWGFDVERVLSGSTIEFRQRDHVSGNRDINPIKAQFSVSRYCLERYQRLSC